MREQVESRRSWIAALAAAGLFGGALVLVVGQPAIGSDQGVFLSVAARLLDGDALYAEVVDNKDPLFFVSYAGALWVGGWRGPSLLDGLWFGLAAIGFAAMLRALGAPRAAVVAGFFVYPLALAGGWYFTGLSMSARCRSHRVPRGSGCVSASPLPAHWRRSACCSSSTSRSCS